MLSQVSRIDGLCVNVNTRSKAGIFDVVIDFLVDDLYFILFDSSLWAVECMDMDMGIAKGKCLIFDGSELVKID